MFAGITAVTLLIVLLIIAVIVMMAETRRRRLITELENANYKTRLNDISLSALRSQMNPHFIFNCLNSIKYFTEQNDSEAASAYLSKFAKIIRSTLDNARREKITLTEEIDSLRLYLELEAMRFKTKLDFLINTDRNVDADFIELPPMIVQPFAENAVWHGLMPKENGGKLEIHIRQEDDAAVFIRIHDNGIGRVKAAELKRQTNPSHQSAGIKITEDRIAMMNEKHPGTASVVITDLYDATGKAAGTEVTIKLPLR